MMRKTAGKNRMAGKGTQKGTSGAGRVRQDTSRAMTKAMAKGKMAQKRTKGYAKGGPVRGNAKKCK